MPSNALPRRVLFVAADSAWAGAQAQMLELAVGLDRSEWDPLLLTCDTGPLAQHARDAGLRVRVLPFRLLRRGFPFVEYYLARPLVLGRLLRRERIALVHTHDPASPIAIAPVAGRLGIPVVAHIHDLDQRWVTRRSLAALARARSRLVAISDAAARWAESRGAPSSRITRIYNGVHLTIHASDARARVRRELSLGGHDVAVALVGRLVERKGQAEAIRALADDALASLAVRLFIIGSAPARDGAYERSLHALVDQLGLGHRVIFLGDRADVPALLAGMDLTLVPSRREAFGRIVVEGMHAGTPIVAWGDGALPELVRHDVDGIIVPAGDIPSFAAAVARLAADSAARNRMAGSARARAREFTHERFVADCSALYASLCTTSPAAPVSSSPG